MRPHTTVETPQRTQVRDQYLRMAQSTESHRDVEVQRGVSTKGSALYRGRFRVQSTRLTTWEYRSNGYYFVTICTKDRAPLLGVVLDGTVRLSRIGEIVAAEWREIVVRRRDLALDEWVVMPNHLHGIVIIRRDPGIVETPQRDRARDGISLDHSLPQHHHDDGMPRGVSTTGAASRLLAGSLGAIIGQFKSRATKRIWLSGFGDFGWQPRFYDHIIRDDRSLDHIRQYIIDNPAKWDSQEVVPGNLWM